MTFQFFSRHGFAIVCALVVMLIIVALAGCAQNRSPTPEQISKIAQDCSVFGTHVAKAQCFNSREGLIYRGKGHPYLDLVSLMQSYRMALAEQVDAGNTTVPQAQLQMDELRVRLNSEVEARNLARKQARSARLASYGVLLQGLGTYNNSLRPAFDRPITCQPFGAGIQCF